jgi:hypothetical protein
VTRGVADLRNITRIDHARTHAWWVRIYRTVEGHKGCTSAMFSDGARGGKRKALKAALAWRDEMLQVLRPPSRRGSTKVVPPGYGYVQRAVLPRRVGSSDCYRAWIRVEGGRCKCTSRSIAVWGVRGAKLQCEEWLAGHRRELRSRRAA